MSFQRIHELFGQGMLWMCLVAAIVCGLAGAVLLLRRISASPTFRSTRLRRGGVGLVLLAVAMLFNSYPTNADKNRARGSVTPSCPSAQEPVPRSGAVGGANGSFSVDAVTDFDGVPVFPAWTNTLDALCITGIAVGQSSVWIRVSWPSNELPSSSLLDVFSARDCNTNTWTFCGSVSVPAATNEIVVAVFVPGSPIPALGRQFFRIGTKTDSDGDGLSDAFERLVSQTDPLASDSDGDGLPDGWEHENGLDPNLWSDAYSDPDGDGVPNLYEYHHGTQPQVSDAVQVERIVAGGSGTNAVATLSAALAASSPYSVIEVADGVHEGPGWSGFSITLPDYPVLITSSDGGRSRRAVIRHAGQMAAMYLNATQTTHTVVQGLCYDLVATNGAQMAFWCGGNLPWSGLPAGGMFRDIYVRMPNPGVRYEGWFFRHYESNEVVIASCTVNAYGATNARGIYAVDSPPVRVENCTFVNFPSNEGGLGYGIQYESTVQNWGGAPDSIPLEIVNCLFDASFTNAYALAPLENGVAYDVSMINCIVPSPLEYEADFTDGLIVTNAEVSFSGHIPDSSPARGAGVTSLYAPVDIDGQDRAAVPDIGADQFVLGAVPRDTDGDGLSDADEDWNYGSDPFFVDSDWDGSPDGMEVANGTDPLDRLSHVANVTLTVTNTFASASVTNYFGFSRSATGWDVTNVNATTCWGLVSNDVTTTAGLYGKAFSDLNRNGVYDEGVDVIRIVCLESEYATVNAVISLGDIDGDRIPDATERDEGTDPYDVRNFMLRATVSIGDDDFGNGITNYVCHSFSETDEFSDVSSMFMAPSFNYVVAERVFDGNLYVHVFRDLNKNGVYDSGIDGVYSCCLGVFNNGRKVDLLIGDSDHDNILDSIELYEGTSPVDRLNYCFNCQLEIYDVFVTPNDLYAEIFFGTNCLYGPVVQTNGTLSLNLGHLITTNAERVVVSFWEDVNGNGEHDQDEPSTVQYLSAQSHDSAYTYRLGLGGFDANHDELPDWWQEAHHVEGEGYRDEDGDGLINLYEWWAGTDPCVPDGSNTVLSVASRSIDSRIANYSPGTSQDVYLNYVENGYDGLFVRNNGCWAFDVDISCASPWHDGAGRHPDCAPTNITVTAISRRHVIYAYHCAYAMSTNLVYYFRGNDGSVITNRLAAFSGIGNDIGVGLLAEELPITVSPAKFLPDDFADYIGDGRYLPSLIIDQNEKAFVAELASFTMYGTRSSLHANISSRNNHRASFAKNYIGGDSSSPRFLVVGEEVVILGALRKGARGSSCLVHLFKQEIQSMMNQLCPGYSITEIDFSPYDKIHFTKGN